MNQAQIAKLKPGDIVWHNTKEPGDDWMSTAIIVHSLDGYDLTEAEHDGHSGVWRDYLDHYEKMIPVTGSCWDVRELSICPAKSAKIGYGTMLDYYALTDHRGREKLTLKKMRERMPRIS